MYEQVTFEVLLGRMLEHVPDEYDRKMGSVIYDALAPAAAELAILYVELDTLINETFADTASRDMLIRRAAERGLAPYAAASAVVLGEFNIPVAAGMRFRLGDFIYTVSGPLGDNKYKLICETAGSGGNCESGTLTPIDYIDGLETAVISGLLSAGEDEEETEHFRARYFDSLKTQSFGGNIADYREKTLSVGDIGGVKVYPVWKGGGTVRLVVQNAAYGKPTEEAVKAVQDLIDPAVSGGRGDGLAPIGHTVTVEGVKTLPINISARFHLTDGWTYASAKPYLESAADDYFAELAAEWDRYDNLIIRISQLEARLLNANSVLDIENMRLNGGSGNITLGADYIPVKGEINEIGGGLD